MAIGSTVLIWTLGNALTTYLADEPSREMKHSSEHAKISEDATGGVSNQARVEEEIAKLKEEHLNDPTNEELELTLANTLFEAGVRLGKSDYLKDSVGYFHEVLEKNPEQKDALLGLATLSLHVGASDKAMEFYERYLKVDPSDDSARTNYALALGRSGETKKAVGILDELLKKDSKFVIALVTKGLLLKEAGDEEEAIKLFSDAEKYEKNPVLLKRIRELMGVTPVHNHEAGEMATLEGYLKNHSIIGPKLVEFKGDRDKATVRLKDFPVDKMPEFAKQKLIGSLKSVLAHGKYSIVNFVDSDSGSQLLEVSK